MVFGGVEGGREVGWGGDFDDYYRLIYIPALNMFSIGTPVGKSQILKSRTLNFLEIKK